MRTRLAASLVVLAASALSLSAADDPWIEVKSPNFTVVSNAAKAGRATSPGGSSRSVGGKLGVDTPAFMIESDATIVAPLLFAIVLGL